MGDGVEVRGVGRRHRDDGITLLLTLVLIAFSSVVLAALVTYAETSNRTVQVYREQRAARYAGDGGIKAAVNWARYQSFETIDAAVAAGRPCTYVRASSSGIVTVSCSTRTDVPAVTGVRRLRFVACVQTEARRTAGQACAKGTDQILTEAGVDVANHLGRAPNVATIRWWATQR